MIRQGELLGDAFDHVILYEDHYLRGRAEGEIIRLFRSGVEKGKRVRQIDEIRGADAAVEFALRSAKPGDLILVQADTVDETVQFHPRATWKPSRRSRFWRSRLSPPPPRRPTRPPPRPR